MISMTPQQKLEMEKFYGWQRGVWRWLLVGGAVLAADWILKKFPQVPYPENSLFAALAGSFLMAVYYETRVSWFVCPGCGKRFTRYPWYRFRDERELTKYCVHCEFPWRRTEPAAPPEE